MNPRIEQLVRSLLQKDSLEQCSLPELEQFAERHPYFGAAQLLLTKKMQTANPERYKEQLQKTFLFFHNPLWVEHLLNDTGKAEIIPANKEDLIATETIAIPESVIPEPAAVEIKEEAVTTQVNMDRENVPVINAEETATEIPAQKTETVVTPKEELLFEPYHTIDYFASQGIKFKEEEKPRDKFGLQLKSFTEWLKTMKKLPVSEIGKNAEPVAERKVEEMAEHSLQEREILTEAMAEVWEKQGNAAKASEIYSKLSLLEPSKSAYFAAKIEDLKKQS
ncbi:MAG TPA: hypothetical protein VMZ03_14545 [Chitinophagaceae bacterium]|nr:hypothetical protein [Chitinophagaceae bacterium]